MAQPTTECDECYGTGKDYANPSWVCGDSFTDNNPGVCCAEYDNECEYCEGTGEILVANAQ
jgi:hypothetical protein